MSDNPAVPYDHSGIVPAAIEKPAAAKAMNYLTIVDADETFPYTFSEFEGTVFTLGLVPEDLHNKWKREHTKTRFDHGVRTEVTDWNGLADVSLFYAVKRIDHLQQSIKGEVVELKWDNLDTAKRRRIVQLLPERCQSEMLRICVGRDVAAEVGESKKA